MSKVVDYYFTPMSPWTYFGHERFVAMAKHHGASINIKPVDYGRIFPASGGLPLAKRAPQRQAYRLVELQRWREFLGIPLNLQPKFFPVAAEESSLAIIAAEAAHGTEAALKLGGALMRACWAEEGNIADPATIERIAGACGIAASPLASAEVRAAAKAKYDAYTQEATERQVFGAPTYIYRDEIFWGQDRLDFVERALSK
jgi:2-hydroxychromene-2-carboxylate isomerase